MGRRHNFRYGIKITNIGGDRYYGFIVQEFPHPGRPHKVEAYIVGRSDLWREVRDKLRDSPLNDELVAINDGALPRQAFRGLRRLVSNHNRQIDQGIKQKREIKARLQ